MDSLVSWIHFYNVSPLGLRTGPRCREPDPPTATAFEQGRRGRLLNIINVYQAILIFQLFISPQAVKLARDSRSVEGSKMVAKWVKQILKKRTQMFYT
jgi:hypothetical protein